MANLAVGSFLLFLRNACLAWGRWLWGSWSASWQENPLVPNKPHQLRIRVHHHVSFHPLYRGTWFPTCDVAGFVQGCGYCFHPLYRGTWFPTQQPADYCCTQQRQVSIRYIAVLGFQRSPLAAICSAKRGMFPSAISRYLVSNSSISVPPLWQRKSVSIRYIAVLGFQR